MSKKEITEKKVIYRQNPACVPLGFRFGNMRNELLFIDMLDESGDNSDLRVFISIALTKSTAEKLKSGLEEFLSNVE